MVLVAVVLGSLSDVVQEGGSLGKLPVGSDLGGEKAGDFGDFLGMREDVLTVARPELQSSKSANAVLIHVVDS